MCRESAPIVYSGTVLKKKELKSLAFSKKLVTSVGYLSCNKVQALGYFQLLGMRYNDRNMVTEKVSTAVLQLYLIWAIAQILEHVMNFQRRI